jgi:hypothetical protein
MVDTCIHFVKSEQCPALVFGFHAIELAGAGHIPMWDATERLSEILLEAGAGQSRRGGGAPDAVARA